MTQNIRLSQFVITWGPGAILEGRNGPRIIPSPDIGIFTSQNNINIEDFEISDERMSKGLLEGAKIFRLPSNSELGYEENWYIYRTKQFPEWSLCLNRAAHPKNSYVLYYGGPCPICRNPNRRGQEAVRFIRACPDGHMDDVDWYYLVHRRHTGGCRHRQWFHWFRGGGSLSDIEIECPECESRQRLGEAYRTRWSCSGRFPEQEPLDAGPSWRECRKEARIIQRQASNLRIPELKTLFTIFWHTKLHSFLQKPAIYANLVGRGDVSFTEEGLKEMLNNLVCKKLITQSCHDSILEHEWSDIHQAIRDIQKPLPPSYGGLILEEFHELVNASVSGAPPARLSIPVSQIIFEVIPEFIEKFSGPNKTLFRVTPIQRLRTVTVQTGYRREVDTEQVEIDTEQMAKIVDIGFSLPRGSQKWYPGVEFLGEGIFIMFDENNGWHQEPEGKTADKWLDAFRDSSSYPPHVFRDFPEKNELHPEFVWWHTMSHLLMRMVSMEAGYSSAAIRERVYFETDGCQVRGGVLLYATQPGSEGTLGGLVALAPYFQDIFEMTFDQLQTCSGDPLCSETEFKKGCYNGAACYSCLLLSETSCEHRNMWLDRNILMENLP